MQKLGPGATSTEPIIIHPGAEVDPDALGRRLVEFGYRREELVEHRGEFARRGAIVDVFPSTADAPIRIDLWGDEVDRLTRFGVNDQRSSGDLDEVMIFPARELMPTDDVRARAERLVASEPWGREHWERLAEGVALRRHGELAAVVGRRRSVAHRRAPRRRQGRARRTTSDARPGPRPDRRRGRPRPHPRVHVGPRPRQVVPPPPRRSRHAARRCRVVLVDRLDPGVARHAAGRGVRLGPGRRRRLGPHRPSDRVDRARLPGGRGR